MGKNFVTKNAIVQLRQTAVELTQLLASLLRSSGIMNQGRGPTPTEQATIYKLTAIKGTHPMKFMSIPRLIRKKRNTIPSKHTAIPAPESMSNILLPAHSTINIGMQVDTS
jgi:hypothetical protein